MATLTGKPARTRDEVADEYRDLAGGNVPGKPKPGQEAEDDIRGRYAFARFASQNDHFTGLYRQWTKTIQFIIGQHHLQWDPTGNRYNPAKNLPKYRMQLTTNYVYTMLRNVSAKMLKQKPALEAIPPSGDSDDRASANLATSLLRYWWGALKISDIHRRSVNWYLATGVVFLRISWDKDGGAIKPLQQLVEIDNPEYDETDPDSDRTCDAYCPCDENGAPIKSEDGKYDFGADAAEMPEGEIGLDVIDPLCVRINPDATSYEDANEYFIARLWPKQKAAKHFNVSVEDLDKSSSDDERKFYDDLMSATAASPNIAQNGRGVQQIGSSLQDAKGQMVVVLEYYSKGQKGFWRGRHWISIGRTKVWPKANDPQYPTGESELPNGFWPPIIPIVATPIPGQPQGISALGQIVPLNETFNAISGRIREHEMKMAMGGKWIKDVSDKGLDLTADPSQVVTSSGYTNNRPPFQAEVKALPAQIYASKTEIRDDIRLVGSLSELAVGQTPEGVTSGRAFLVQEEVTDSVWGPDLQAFERALAEVGRRCLIVCRPNYTEERVVKIKGNNGQWEYRAFKGSDLVDGLDVEVQAGSSAPFSKTAAYDANISLIQAAPGLITEDGTAAGPVDPSKLARLLGTGRGGFSTFESDEDPDTVEAMRQQAMFAAFDPHKSTSGQQPELPQLGWWMNFQKLLQLHANFMKRDRGSYDKWAPEAQEAFQQFCAELHEAVDQQAGTIVDAADQGGGVPADGMGAGTPGDPNGEPGETDAPSNDMQQPQLTSAEMAGSA